MVVLLCKREQRQTKTLETSKGCILIYFQFRLSAQRGSLSVYLSLPLSLSISPTPTITVLYISSLSPSAVVLLFVGRGSGRRMQ